MEGYIANTKAFLGIIQSIISEDEFKKSCQAGEKMYEAISSISEEHGLSMREMLNAVITINAGVLEIMQEQIQDMKGEDQE